MKNIKYITLIFFGTLIGCLEEIPNFDPLDVDSDMTDLLVVEGVLTDLNELQTVKLSRAVGLSEDDLFRFEENASVAIVAENGMNYSFSEAEPGLYLSDTPFSAQIGVRYQLRITTSQGEQLQSTFGQIQGESNIESIYAERITSDSGVDGMAIIVESSSDSNQGRFFRYTYEETYKIIAPNWTDFEFRILSEGNPETGEFPDVDLVPRAQEEQVCYNTVSSNEIILASSESLTGNRIDGNMIRFINAQDPILSHRYSILVRQHLQSADAFNFYETLKNISESDDLFSQIQPGFIEGNLAFIDDSGKQVIGFFDVVSVSERRLFFNYDDFFEDEPLPPYFDGLNCDNIFAPILGNPNRDGVIPEFENCGEDLISQVKLEKVEYFLGNGSPGECEGPYFVVLRPCGDCTALGTNQIPEFWEE